MSDYKYQDWYEHLYEKHGANVSAQAAEGLVDFINHQLRQVQNAREANTSAFSNGRNCMAVRNAHEANTADDRWEYLMSQSGRALEALASGQVKSIAMAFCGIGQAIERLRHPSWEERQSAYKDAVRGHELEKGKFIRELPLRMKAFRQQLIKDQITESAWELWENDSDKELRIGEVAILLMDEAEEAAKMLDTDKPSHATIKGWLREIAPAYAKKKGAPKKNRDSIY